MTIGDAHRAKCLIRFTHPFEQHDVRGYVLDVGSRFFLLAVLSDRIWFDGFECFRICDAKRVRKDPHASFAEAALRRRRERRPKKPRRVNLGSMRDLLLSADRGFPLVTIHRERIDPRICHIGRVVGTDRTYVSLREITPNATWEIEPTRYRLSEVTRVGFGADYEGALALVGGRSQANKRLQRTTAGKTAGNGAPRRRVRKGGRR